LISGSGGESGFIEWRQVRLRNAKGFQVATSSFEPVDVGKRRSVTPGKTIGAEGGFGGRSAVAGLLFERCQKVASVGVKQGVGTSLGRLPQVGEETANRCRFAFAVLDLSQCDEEGKFLLDQPLVTSQPKTVGKLIFIAAFPAVKI